MAARIGGLLVTGSSPLEAFRGQLAAFSQNLFKSPFGKRGGKTLGL
jgi:hypothetical protein